MRIRTPRSGFSLIEVMVALALLGVVTYFLVSTLKNGSMGQKTLQAQDDARALTDEIATLLSNSKACSNTFGSGQSPDGTGMASPVNANPVNGTVMPPNGFGGTAVTGIYNGASPPAAQFVLGQKYGNRGLTLNGITIGGGSPAGSKDPKSQQVLWTPGQTSGTGAAFVSLDWLQTGSVGNAGIGPQHLYRWFMVNVNSMSGNDIVDCTAQVPGGNVGSGAPNTLAMWSGPTNPTMLLGSSIVYQNGVSGIGVGATPVSAVSTLDVAGGVSIGAYAGASAAPTNGMVVSGNVGIGVAAPKASLDVNGGIHPGGATSGQNCGSSVPPGTFAYDSAADASVFCSQKTGLWTAMGGAPFGGMYMQVTSCTSCGFSACNPNGPPQWTSNPVTGSNTCPAFAPKVTAYSAVNIAANNPGDAPCSSTWTTTVYLCTK